jgi:hypothetical protein
MGPRNRDARLLARSAMIVSVSPCCMVFTEAGLESHDAISAVVHPAGVASFERAVRREGSLLDDAEGGEGAEDAVLLKAIRRLR